MKWKKVKKREKIKERKGKKEWGVVGRGNLLPEEIMGFSKQEACMHVLDLRVGLCNEM